MGAIRGVLVGSSLSHGQLRATYYVGLIVSCISVAGSLLIICIYLLGRWVSPHSVQRTTLHLLVIKSAADALTSTLLIVNYHVESDVGCSVSFTFLVWFLLFSVALQTVIGLNVFFVFVMRKTFSRRVGQLTVIGLFLFTLIISIIPLAAHRYGLNEYYNFCSFVPSFSDGFLPWAWVGYIGWAILAWIILIVCEAAVIYKLVQSRWAVRHNIKVSETMNDLPGVSHYNMAQQRHTARIIRHSIIRILLYCLVPMLTTLCPVWNFLVAYYVHPHSFALVMLLSLLTPLQGVLNAAIFITEPAVTSVMRATRHRLISRCLLSQGERAGGLEDRLGLDGTTATNTTTGSVPSDRVPYDHRRAAAHANKHLLSNWWWRAWYRFCLTLLCYHPASRGRYPPYPGSNYTRSTYRSGPISMDQVSFISEGGTSRSLTVPTTHADHTDGRATVVFATPSHPRSVTNGNVAASSSSHQRGPRPHRANLIDRALFYQQHHLRSSTYLSPPPSLQSRPSVTQYIARHHNHARQISDISVRTFRPSIFPEEGTFNWENEQAWPTADEFRRTSTHSLHRSASDPAHSRNASVLSVYLRNLETM
ncbi:hypothetical protein H4R33_001571 [Dimargaris cristalligena]|nr:hypothetical protein H4R33_001571 [Dimargaris cristalligena]